MTIVLEAGKTKRLDASLMPVGELAILLSDLSIVPSSPVSGDTVYFRCRATNHSPVGATLSRHIDLLVDGQVVKSWDLTLAWAETVYLEHSLIATGVGVHSVEFDGLVGSYETLAGPPANLFTPETRKLLFDAHGFYAAYSDYGDPDIAALNSMLASCDITISKFEPIVPDNARCYVTINGDWKIGDIPLEGELPYMPIDILAIERTVYETAQISLPYPSNNIATGLEDWLNKFYTDCCEERGYLPEWDWKSWHYVIPLHHIGFHGPSYAPKTTGLLSIIEERTWGGAYWSTVPSPLPSGEYIIVVQADIAYFRAGGWYYPPLYVWGVGKVVV